MLWLRAYTAHEDPSPVIPEPVASDGQLPNGRTIGGIPFTRGPLAHLLRNRFYIGEVAYKGKICPGEQPPILDRDLFEAVQAKLSEQRTSHYATRGSSESLLLGRIFDDRGNRMTPSHSSKHRLRYRYYVSSALIQGQPELVGSVTRVPAAEIESLVSAAVGQQFANEPAADVRELVRHHVARVDVTATAITVTIDPIPRRSADQTLDLAVRGRTGKARALAAALPSRSMRGRRRGRRAPISMRPS